MAIAPLGVGRFRFLADRVVWSLKDHAKINQRILFDYLKNLLTIFAVPITFGL